MVFTDTGVGGVTVGAGVTPGTLSFTHGTGTYTLTGTAFNAAANLLTVNGGGTVRFGNMTNSAYTPTWGNTSVTGGSTVEYTRGSFLGSSGATITLNDGPCAWELTTAGPTPTTTTTKSEQVAGA